MANTPAKKLTYDSKPVQVESAIRDGTGKVIADTYYVKPSAGIPKTDLASAVQTSLGKADTALQTAPVTSVNNQTGAVTLSIPVNISSGAVAPSAATSNGFYYINSSTNSLSGADSNPVMQYHTSNTDFRILATAYSSSWVQQIATDFRTNNIYFRRKDNGTWKDWVKISTSEDLASYAPLASPALTGTPTAPTAAADTNTTQIATTAFVMTQIDKLPEPMLFKGTLGTGGTITSLPTAAAGNEGWVYKVITAGTYASQAAKIGDLFICANTSTTSTPSYAWTYVPSGDEPSGTVTNVATGAGLTGGPITTSGTISHATSGVTAGTYQSVTVNTYGHVTAGSNPFSATDVSITEED